MTPEEIKYKFRRSFVIIKTIVKMNKISKDIRNFGTSDRLFDINTRDRESVKRYLYPLDIYELLEE